MPEIKMLQSWRDYQSGEVINFLNDVVCAAWVNAGIAQYTTGTDVQEIEAETEEKTAEVPAIRGRPPRVSA